MDVTFASGDISRFEADAVVVGLFEDGQELDEAAAAVDRALGSGITRLRAAGEIKGKPGENTLIHTLGRLPAARVVVVGLGKRAELTPDRIRGAIAETCRMLRGREVRTVATVPLGAGSNGISAGVAAQVLTEGAKLGLYTFRRHVTREPEHGEIDLVTIIGGGDDLVELEQGVRRGRVLAGATILARDMVNEPPNHMGPEDMARRARELGEAHGFEVEVLEREQIERLGMGALLGVAQGSHRPPRFIIMRYRGRKDGAWDIALVGKAITFDSGGISIKPAAAMSDMKGDMSGGAAVIGAMVAIGQLGPGVNVLGLVPATENLPGGGAYRPSDILTSMSGKTIEVTSTDAEGRLILADALEYARRQGVARIVDVATLTGAVVVALGTVCTGVFGNNQELIDAVLAAGAETGEKMWQMPTFDEYKEQNKSDVADIKNTGGRNAGAITGALFVGEFAGDTPWVHLDIAGTNMLDKTRRYEVKGATGVPVRSLVALVLALAGRQKEVG